MFLVARLGPIPDLASILPGLISPTVDPLQQGGFIGVDRGGEFDQGDEQSPSQEQHLQKQRR
jgi:hypothetical protein